MSKPRVEKKLITKGEKIAAIRVEFKDRVSQQYFYKLLDIADSLNMSQTALAREILKGWASKYDLVRSTCMALAGMEIQEEITVKPDKADKKNKKPVEMGSIEDLRGRAKDVNRFYREH